MHPCLIPAVNLCDRVPGLYALADDDAKEDSDAVIDGVFGPAAAGAQAHRRQPDRFRSDPRQIPAALRLYRHAPWRERQPPAVIDTVRIAALSLDDPPPPLQAFSRSQRLRDPLARLIETRRDSSQVNKSRRQLDRKLRDVLRPAALQGLDALDHLQ